MASPGVGWNGQCARSPANDGKCNTPTPPETIARARTIQRDARLQEGEGSVSMDHVRTTSLRGSCRLRGRCRFLPTKARPVASGGTNDRNRATTSRRVFDQQAMLSGRATHAATYGRTLVYDEALARLIELAHAESERKPAFCRWLLDTLARPCGPAQLLWAARWAGCGFPQVTLGHRLASSLCATRMDPEAAEAVMPPWPAYLVLVPDGLFEVPDKLVPSATMPIDWLTVFHAGPFVHVTARSRSSEFTLNVGHRTLASGLADEEGLLDDEVLTPPGPGPVDAVHRRALAMLWRLMVGIDIEMTEPRNVERPRRGPKPLAHDKRAALAPLTHRLVRDVVVDCRAAVSDFVEGRRSAPSVQVLVRGHWKRQVHGSGRALRRFVHIEPYWRGPEDAPLALRVHKLRG